MCYYGCRAGIRALIFLMSLTSELKISKRLSLTDAHVDGCALDLEVISVGRRHSETSSETGNNVAVKVLLARLFSALAWLAPPSHLILLHFRQWPASRSGSSPLPPSWPSLLGLSLRPSLLLKQSLGTISTSQLQLIPRCSPSSKPPTHHRNLSCFGAPFIREGASRAGGLDGCYQSYAHIPHWQF
uniref:Uncharacterized protein n=1 Tax=Mycena chlorophos TaxID=658473 RepID=A0ABQ0L7Q3_MYCCL|nr:predicted protein [Mycena chlorophos]